MKDPHTNHLAEALLKVINYHRSEFSLTLATVVGTLHVLAAELIMEESKSD